MLVRVQRRVLSRVDLLFNACHGDMRLGFVHTPLNWSESPPSVNSGLMLRGPRTTGVQRLVARLDRGPASVVTRGFDKLDI